MKKCELIALADGFVCCEVFEGRRPIVQPMIELGSTEEFVRLRTENSYLNSMYHRLSKAYGNARSNGFSFVPDEYGGYGLVYSGEVALPASVILDLIVGYTERLPKKESHLVSYVSVLGPTDLCSFERVMAGPIRFVNHCCEPNCEYIASEDDRGRKCVKLKTLQSVKRGESLTVFYGCDYFDEKNMNCLCPYKNRHFQEATSKLREVENARVIVPASNFDHPKGLKSQPPSRINLKRRMAFTNNASKRCKTIMRDEWRRHSSSSESSPSLVFRDEQSTIVQQDASASNFVIDVSDLCSSSDDSLGELFAVFHSTPAPSMVSHFSSDESVCSEPEKYVVENHLELRAQINCPCSNLIFCSYKNKFFSHDENEETLKVTSNITLDNVILCSQSIISKHATSDAQAADWFKLMRALNPRIPSYKTVKRHLRSSVGQLCEDVIRNANGKWITLRFRDEITDIVSRYLKTIINYESWRLHGQDLILPTAIHSSSIRIFLLLNSDGVRIVESNRKSLWPVWFGIANLPPRLRCAFNNIVLAGLWFGTGKPDWSVCFQIIQAQLNDRKQISLDHGGKRYLITFEVVLLIADLPAKTSLLNMKQHNGFFGCTLCLSKGERVGGVHYYKNRTAAMRTSKQHNACLAFLNDNPLRRARCGVKGNSPLLKFIPNLPLTAPIDYMHQVLLGVTRVLLHLIAKEVGNKQQDTMTAAVKEMKLTSEFKRSVRGLNELAYFKANELKTWLLYVGPVVLSDFVSAETYERFMLLSYAIRLLLSDVKYSAKGGDLIQLFLDETEKQYTEMSFSPNVHALSHLAWQVSCFGPLWATSAIMFESANYLLKSSFTGTVCHLELIVERYIRRKELLKETVKKDALSDVINAIMKKNRNPLNAAVDHSKIPAEYRDGSCDRFFAVHATGIMELDSCCSSRGERNSVVSFRDNRRRFFGEIIVFMEKSSVVLCLVRLMKVKKLYRCHILLKTSPLSYVIVDKTDKLLEVPIDAIDFKLLRIDYAGELFLTPIMNHFEHD